jgi:hypothetical protein
MSRVARFLLIQTYQIGKNVTNYLKLYEMALNYTKWTLNIPNCHKIYQHLPFKGPPKFTQICIFGLKTNHLATLVMSTILRLQFGGRQNNVRSTVCVFVACRNLNSAFTYTDLKPLPLAIRMIYLRIQPFEWS